MLPRRQIPITLASGTSVSTAIYARPTTTATTYGALVSFEVCHSWKTTCALVLGIFGIEVESATVLIRNMRRTWGVMENRLKYHRFEEYENEVHVLIVAIRPTLNISILVSSIFYRSLAPPKRDKPNKLFRLHPSKIMLALSDIIK